MAKFIAGQSGNPAGKPVGAISSRTRNLQATLERHGFDLGETWLDLLAQARSGFLSADKEQQPQYLKIAVDITNSIADRLAPRLKAIEHKQTSPMDGLSAEQRIEMLKAATKALEDDVGRERDIGSSGIRPGDLKPEKI